MKNMIKIENLLKHLLLMFLMIGASEGMAQQQQAQQAQQAQPADSLVFQLIAYNDSTGLKFKNGNPAVGYLRLPNDVDRNYYIATNKHYIKVSNETSPKESINADRDIRRYEASGKFASLGKKVTTGFGYYEIRSNSTFKFSIDGCKFIVDRSPNTYEEPTKITVNDSIKKELRDNEKTDTLFFNVGDTIKSLKVSRKARGFIDSLCVGGEKKEGEYCLNVNGQNVNRCEDDFAPTTSSFVVKDPIHLDRVGDYPLIVYQRYIKVGNLAGFERKIIINVKEKENEDMFSKIKQWFTTFFTPDERSAPEASSGGNKRDDDNGKLKWILISAVVLLGIVGVVVWLYRKRRVSSPENVTANGGSGTDGKGGNGSGVTANGGSGTDGKGGNGSGVAANGGSGTDGKGGNGSGVDVSGSGKASDIGRQVFKNISNEDAAKYLLIYLGNKSGLEKDDINKELSKCWIRRFSDEWNKEYKDAGFEIPDNQRTRDVIFKTIENLRDKAVEDGKEEENKLLNGRIGTSESKIAGLEQEQEQIKADVKSILGTMSEKHYIVECSSSDVSVKKGLEAIKNAIESGVQQEGLQKENNDLKKALQAEKDAHAAAMQAEKNAHAVALQAEEDAHAAAMQAEKDAHAAALQAEKDAHAAALQSEKDAHAAAQQAEKDAHQAEVKKLNDTISSKEARIAELIEASHADCVSYIGMVVKRMNIVYEQLNELYSKARLISGDNETQYTTILQKAIDDFNGFADKVMSANAEEKWLQTSVSLADVCKDLQSYVYAGFFSAGWVNIIHYLNLYAGATRKLNDSFNENGLSTTELAKLVADVQRFLGMFGVKVVVPHLLIDKFDKNAFDYENADRWIQSFSSELKPNDYKSMVFDMSIVGYQIDDENYNKPKVFYS